MSDTCLQFFFGLILFSDFIWFLSVLVLVQEEITGVEVEATPIKGEEEEEGELTQGK